MFLYGKGKRLVWKCTLPEISMACFRRDRIFIHVIDRSVLLHVSPKSGIKGQSFLKQSYSFDASIFSLIAFNVSLPIKYKPFKIVIRLRKTFVLEEIHQEQMFKHKCSKKKKPWTTKAVKNTFSFFTWRIHILWSYSSDNSETSHLASFTSLI